MNNPVFSRKLSASENAYIHLQSLYTCFAIQYVIAGQGAVDKDAFETAVARASDACPGSRVRLKNRRWVDTGQTPPVTYLNDWNFDGFQFSKSDLFQKKIDPYKDPVAEIYIAENHKIRFLFRIFHGAMDGKGAMIWIENIFKALNNEPLVQATSPETDIDLVKKLPHKKNKPALTRNKVLLSNGSNNETDRLYSKRMTLPDHYPGVVAKLAKIVTDNLSENGSRILIPVDLRRHGSGMDCTSNLTLPIFLETQKGQSWKEINGSLIYQLKNNAELNVNNTDFGILSKLPVVVQKKIITTLVSHQRRSHRYVFGGNISHVGRFHLSKFSTATFKAATIYSIPIHIPFFPLSIVLVETKGKTEIVISTYHELISENDMEALMGTIAEGLIG